MFNRSSNVLYWINVKGSGKNTGGNTLAFPSPINDAPIIHKKGTSVMNDEIIRKLYIKTILIMNYSSEI